MLTRSLLFDYAILKIKNLWLDCCNCNITDLLRFCIPIYSNIYNICLFTARKLPEVCVDKPWYANCELIVEADLCQHPYFSVFCCSTCHKAGLL